MSSHGNLRWFPQITFNIDTYSFLLSCIESLLSYVYFKFLVISAVSLIFRFQLNPMGNSIAVSFITFRTWWGHLLPWQPLFWIKEGQCFPPFCGCVCIFLCRVVMPVPQSASHSDHGPHGDTTQSITETNKKYRIKKKVVKWTFQSY